MSAYCIDYLKYCSSLGCIELILKKVFQICVYISYINRISYSHLIVSLLIQPKTKISKKNEQAFSSFWSSERTTKYYFSKCKVYGHHNLRFPNPLLHSLHLTHFLCKIHGFELQTLHFSLCPSPYYRVQRTLDCYPRRYRHLSNNRNF